MSKSKTYVWNNIIQKENDKDKEKDKDKIKDDGKKWSTLRAEKKLANGTILSVLIIVPAETLFTHDQVLNLAKKHGYLGIKVTGGPDPLTESQRAELDSFSLTCVELLACEKNVIL